MYRRGIERPSPSPPIAPRGEGGMRGRSAQRMLMEEMRRLAEEQRRLVEEQRRLAEEQRRLAEQLAQEQVAQEQVIGVGAGSSSDDESDYIQPLSDITNRLRDTADPPHRHPREGDENAPPNE